MAEWISVKDELPKNWQRVLAVYNHYIITIARYSKKWRGKCWEICGRDVDNNSITYWMPLPEPPKEMMINDG